MIIDLILDRKDGEAWGVKYSAHSFYLEVLKYESYDMGNTTYTISKAMDYGTEEDVRQSLCDYIMKNDYNPQICEYINNRKWLEDDE